MGYKKGMSKGTGSQGYGKLKQGGLATRARGKMNWGTGHRRLWLRRQKWENQTVGVGNYDVALSG